MNKGLKYGVFGNGSWATAIIKMLCENLDDIEWYIRTIHSLEYIKKERHNPSYLSSVELDTNKLNMSCDINTVVKNSDVLIFAIPSAFIHKQLQRISVDISSKIIVSAVKGIVPESGLLVADHFCESHNVSLSRIAVIGGPCHAEEVALERLSYITIASKNTEAAKEVASSLSSHYIKTRVHDDIVGAEHAAMLKNIYAIAAGVSHGLGYGDNFQSVLMSNAIREMKRFIKKVYKMKRKINETLYLGDLLVTGYSTFSRNRMFGNMIGKGYTVKAAQLEMKMVAEGYIATKKAFLLNQDSINKTKTPIIDSVYKILYKKRSARKIFKELSDVIS